MKCTQPILTLILGLLLALPLTVSGQATAESLPEPLVIRSTGLLDTDGTALYSVLLVSGEDDLTDLGSRAGRCGIR